MTKSKRIRGKIAPEARRKFWGLGVLAAIFLAHASGIFAGSYSGMSIVSYDDAIILGAVEVLLAIVLTPVFLWKMVVWWHDRPFSPRHAFDDPGILD